MKINSVKIKNFRSISETQFDITGGKIAFVGGNESGKSNVLLAIQRFLNKEDFQPEDQYQLAKDLPEIELSFDNLTDKEKQNILEITGKESSTLVINRIGNTYNILHPELPDEIDNSTETTDAENAPEDSSDETVTTIVDPVEPQKEPTEVTVDTTKTQDVTADAAVGEPDSPEKSVLIPKEEAIEKLKNLIPNVYFIKTVEGLIKGKNLPINELFSDGQALENRTLTTQELKNIKAFLALGGIEQEDIMDKDTGRAFHNINQKAAIIAQKLSSAWKQERVEIRMSANTTNLVIELKDCGSVEDGEAGKDTTKWIWTYPEDRSEGFRWFVTFYSGYLYGVSKDNNTIFLIDEAGGSLNKRAQKDLLDEFDHLSGEYSNAQILYATHSKDMVSWDFKNDVYVVIKNKGVGTKVSGKWWSKFSQNLLPPPLDELGVTWSEDLLANDNLIVEGPIDLETLKRLKPIFQDEGIPEDPFLSFKIIPAMGIFDSMVELAEACKYHKKKSFLLFDFDADGVTAKGKATTAGLKANDINTLANNPTPQIKTIEDFLPRKKYIEQLNKSGVEAFGENWAEIKKVSGADSNGIIYALIQRIESNTGKSHREVKDFMIRSKYEIAMNTIKSICLDDFTDSQKNAIKNLYTNLETTLKGI